MVAKLFEEGWQSVEEILAQTPLPAFRYKSRVTRAKLVDVGIQLPGQLVALVVTLTLETSVEIHIRLQVYSTDEQTHLPNNLTVQVLDGQGAAGILKKAEGRRQKAEGIFQKGIQTPPEKEPLNL